MGALNALVPQIGLARACAALHINRASVYRDRARHRCLASSPVSVAPRPRAPRTVYARLLDEGTYLASVRTMYRLLAAAEGSRERRNQRVHPVYTKSELLALQPNQVWSWDNLEVAKTHSRPHVSDDNPYSETKFKTLKYRPDFPERFGSIEDARAHCQHFFHWYNMAHCQSGIGLMTPESVHYGRAPTIFTQRAETLNVAFLANPRRFKGKIPQPPKLQTAAWINLPKPETATQTTLDSSTLLSSQQYWRHMGRGKMTVRVRAIAEARQVVVRFCRAVSHPCVKGIERCRYV